MNIRLISHDDNKSRYIDFECLPDENLYDASTRAGVKLPVSCKNGVCHICRGKLLSGTVITGSHNGLVNADERVSPEIMLCSVWPQSSCEIVVKNVYGPKELPLKKLACQVVSVNLSQAHVYQLELLLPAGKLPEFFPGQYLAIDLPEREGPAYFSIASRPGSRTLELHIQADPHLASALEIVQHLQKNSCVSVSLPYGDACLTEQPDKALILMAAGTGFAQMKSIIEHLLFNNHAYPISLYWAVRKEEDMYMKSLALAWEKQYENFHFKPVIADIDDKQGVGHHDQMSEAVLADHPDLRESRVFVSGSPKLVFSAMDALIEAGLPESQFFSDVLAYANRSDFMTK